MARDSPTTDLDFSASPRRAALPRYGHRAGRRRRPEEIILDAGDPVVPGGGQPGARLRQSRRLVGAEPISSLQADGHVEKAHEYYAHLGHHIVGDNTVCKYTPGKKRMQEPRDLKIHLRTCGKAPADLLAWCHKISNIHKHQTSETCKQQRVQDSCSAQGQTFTHHTWP